MLIRIKDYNLERFFEGKDYVDFQEIIDKLFELDDEICYLQERYDDAVGSKEKKYDYTDELHDETWAKKTEW